MFFCSSRWYHLLYFHFTKYYFVFFKQTSISKCYYYTAVPKATGSLTLVAINCLFLTNKHRCLFFLFLASLQLLFFSNMVLYILISSLKNVMKRVVHYDIMWVLCLGPVDSCCYGVLSSLCIRPRWLSSRSPSPITSCSRPSRAACLHTLPPDSSPPYVSVSNKQPKACWKSS